jgi:hypothetical protein
VVSLDDRVVAGTFYAYKRLPHVQMSSLQVFRLVSRQQLIQTSPRPAECCSEKYRPPPVFVDNTLSTAALEDAQRFSRRQSGRPYRYIFCGETRLRTGGHNSRCASTTLPRNLEGRGLAQLWAYKHVQGGSDTELYAEMSAVSAHLRIRLLKFRSIVKLAA